MFRFEHISYFGLLILIPVTIAIYFIFIKKQKEEWDALGDQKKLNLFSFGERIKSNIVKLVAGIASFILLVFALANPQFSNKLEEVDVETTDVFIALDISRSMLADDIKPNRLERAKFLSKEILKQLEGNRIGLILFAGEAYMHMPLTTDVSSAFSFLEAANPEMAPSQGTAIAASINLAVKSFDEENDSGKALIILSDGEDHEADLDDAIDLAEDNQVLVFTVAVGTEEGAFLPGTQRSNYLFDEEGKPIKSQVNYEMLENISDETGANFFILDKERNIDKAIKGNIDQMEKQITSQASYNSYESYFQYLLFPVILLIGYQLIRSIMNRKNKLHG